jgi:hypothetical protein
LDLFLADLDFGMTWDVLVVNKLRQPNCQIVQNLFKKKSGAGKTTNPPPTGTTHTTYEDITSDHKLSALFNLASGK